MTVLDAFQHSKNFHQADACHLGRASLDRSLTFDPHETEANYSIDFRPLEQ